MRKKSIVSLDGTWDETDDGFTVNDGDKDIAFEKDGKAMKAKYDDLTLTFSKKKDDKEKDE